MKKEERNQKIEIARP